jgi:DNA-binding MarR family transcriptional regulator
MTTWLSAEQQEYWRAWLAASMLLRDQLTKEIQEQHGLTMADYEILVQLSENPERRMRMSELATCTLVSRSRLTHQIDRMEKAGYVERQECRDDRRGFFAVLTDLGMQAIIDAAPDHVASVRAHMVDLLTPAEFAALGKASQKVVDALMDVE